MEWPVDIDQIEDPTARAVLMVLRPMFTQLQTTIDDLRQQLAKKEQETEELRRLLFGQKSERRRTPRMSSTEQEIKKQKAADLTPEEKERKRLERAEKRKRKREERLAALPVIERTIEIAEERLVCEHCPDGGQFSPLGSGEVNERIEYVPAHLVKERITRQKMACRCGQCIVTAYAPADAIEGATYGPGLHAHTVVAKCADAIPLNRQATILRRSGVEVSKNTLGDVFHRCAERLRPLYDRILLMVAASTHVNADETTIKVQAKKKCHTCYMWTFIADGLISFVFSPSRSGETPDAVLKGTTGKLQVDGHSGYNRVCVPDGRERVGCLAHARRKFFEARSSAEAEANEALSLILKLYEVEYRAAAQGILGTPEHLALRKIESKPVLQEMKRTFQKWKKEHAPKSALIVAVNYMLKSWKEMTAFTTDAKLALDNNISERSLRPIAQGRKNFLFVGNNKAGRNLAVLQTLVASCGANNINPFDYLRDVLIRVQTHPASELDELLPHRWRPPDDSDESHDQIST